MHALGQLIHQCISANPTLTYQRIADLSGGAFSKGLIGQWANKEIETLNTIPRPRSLIGLAQALQIPIMDVLLAAAQATGLPINNQPSQEFLAKIPPAVNDLPPQVQQHLIDVIWSAIRIFLPPSHYLDQLTDEEVELESQLDTEEANDKD